MNKFIWLLFLVFVSEAFAWQQSFIVQATSGSPVPAAFDKANSQSLVMTSLVNVTKLCIFNETGTRIGLNTINWNAASPTTVTHRIPKNNFLCIDDKISSSVYIDGDGTAITDSNYIHGYAK